MILYPISIKKNLEKMLCSGTDKENKEIILAARILLRIVASRIKIMGITTRSSIINPLKEL